jgi:hypothetical protein
MTRRKRSFPSPEALRAKAEADAEKKAARAPVGWRKPFFAAALVFWIVSGAFFDALFPAPAAQNAVRAGGWALLALGWGALGLRDRAAPRELRQADGYVVVLGLVLAAHSAFRAAFPAADAFRYSILLVVVTTLLIGFHSKLAHRRSSGEAMKS